MKTKKIKEKKKKSLASLLSNCGYMLGFAYKANKAIYSAKIPLIIINAIVPFVPIVFVRLILNEITIGKDIKLVMTYALLLALTLFVVNTLKNIFTTLSAVQTTKTLYSIKKMLGEAVTKLPYSELEKPKIKDFISLSEDNTLFLQILNGIASVITSLITAIGLAAIVFTSQPLIIILTFLVVLARLTADKKTRKLWDIWRPRFAPFTREVAYFHKLMTNTEFGKEIRINRLEDWIYAKLEKTDEKYLRDGTNHNIAIQKINSFSEFAVIAQEGIVYLMLAYRVVFSGMTIGDFSMYLTAINSFTGSIQSMVVSFSELMKNGLFAQDFRFCIEASKNGENSAEKSIEASKNAENPIKAMALNTKNLTIEFKNVSFMYPNTDRMILQNISLTLSPKETLSIVGLNGAGKTTFVKLLCRFYEPTEGEITIGNVPINTIPKDDYYKFLGVVFQDFKLFSFEVIENVSLSEEFNESEVLSCIEQVGLKEKIESLPKGSNTMLYKEFDKEGIEFSGGEGQKLAIARTLYKNAPIIILDEPTSALDPIAEYEIYKCFDDLVHGKIAIYISHRLSSTRFTDKIAVFSEGRIAEYGSHDELIKIDNGIYKAMFETQAQYYI